MLPDLSASELNGYVKLFEGWIDNQYAQKAVFIRCGGLGGVTQEVAQCMFNGSGLQVINRGQAIADHLNHYQQQNDDLAAILPDVDEKAVG